MEFTTQISNCIEVVDQYGLYFLCYQEEDYMSLIGPLLEVLEQTLTSVVELYESEEMAAYKEEQAYWPNQLSRIVGALSSGDRFLIYDTLMNELRPNLLEVAERVRGL